MTLCPPVPLGMLGSEQMRRKSQSDKFLTYRFSSRFVFQGYH